MAKLLRFNGQMCVVYKGIRLYITANKPPNLVSNKNVKYWIVYATTPNRDGHAARTLLSAIKGWYNLYL